MVGYARIVLCKRKWSCGHWPLPCRQALTDISAKTWLKRCWSFAGALLEHCWSVAGALLEHCWSIAGALLEHCWSIAGALLERCWSIAGALREHCWSIVYVENRHVLHLSLWFLSSKRCDACFLCFNSRAVHMETFIFNVNDTLLVVFCLCLAISA